MTEVENEIDPRPSSILNAITGATGLVVNGDNALKEFDLVFDQMGEVGVALEEAGMSSNKVRRRLAIISYLYMRLTYLFSFCPAERINSMALRTDPSFQRSPQQRHTAEGKKHTPAQKTFFFFFFFV